MHGLVRYLKGIPRALWLYWGFLFALMYAFALLAEEVVEREGIAFDERILALLEHAQTPVLDAFMGLLDIAGGYYVLLPVSVVIVVLMWRHARRCAVFFALAFWGASALNALAKLVFERTRPEMFDALVPAPGYAFPSGHTMGSTAFALAAYFVMRKRGWDGWWTLPAAIAFALIVGFSRSYFQVHYPSDVVAGWILSTAWVLGARAWYMRRSEGLSWPLS